MTENNRTAGYQRAYQRGLDAALNRLQEPDAAMVEAVRDAVADRSFGCQNATCTNPMSEDCECAIVGRAALRAAADELEKK